jgi:hypothetical protein
MRQSATFINIKEPGIANSTHRRGHTAPDL